MLGLSGISIFALILYTAAIYYGFRDAWLEPQGLDLIKGTPAAAWSQFVRIIAWPFGVCLLVALWLAGWSALIIASLIDSLSHHKRRLERQTASLREARDTAVHATQAKSEFLAHMSHEIRTPLTAIIGFAETLTDDAQLAPEASKKVHTILRSSRHLLHIINEILDLSKIEARRLSLEKLTLVPLDLVTEVTSLMAEQAARKSLHFRVLPQFPLPASLQGDPVRIRQILMNLCSNAIKFTSTGSVDLWIYFDRVDRILKFDVRDTGIGITAEQQQRIFQEFVQADGSTTREYGGTGLGLCLSQRLARMMGGDIEVSSEPGVGSCFCFTLPVDGAQALIWEQTKTSTIPRQTMRPSLRGRVLIAEDNRDIRELLVQFLAPTGVELNTASDGEQAVIAAAQQTPDLILMDMRMPLLDGLDATRRIRAQGYQGPIIALSANTGAGDAQRCLAAGCSAFLHKPVERVKLYKTVAGYLDRLAAPDIAGDREGAVHSTLLEQDPSLAELVQQFVHLRLPDYMDQLQVMVAQAQWREISELLHQLKGAGGAYGFPTLSTQCEDWTADLSQGDALRVSVHYRALAQLVERIRAGHATR